MTPMRLLALSVLTLFVTTASAIEIGLTDDFQDNTTQNWAVGQPHPAPPFTVADAGPDGSGDFALQVDSLGGGGPGSRLAVFNRTQWSGDWTTAGVTAVQADIKVVGANDLDMRVGFQGAGGRIVSADSVSLAGDGTWQTLVFSVLEADLVTSGGTSVADTLAAVSEFRFLHNPNADFRGAVIAESILIDNVIALPEPSALVLLAIGGLAVIRRR